MEIMIGEIVNRNDATHQTSYGYVDGGQMQQHIGRRQPASGTTKVHMTYEIKYVAAFPFEARRETRRATLNTVTENTNKAMPYSTGLLVL